ncbi:MAG TPA: alpha-hydroxy acid oxidase, partial [Polyangiales bacterium]|nr:alpha-hydroxy acid oxidase [Polyangiales bacterium]
MNEPVNLQEYEALAAAALPGFAWDYYRSGANDELTLAHNRRAFDEIRLRYRVLVDVSRRSTATRLLGRELALPELIAPTAFHRLAHTDGELATARAAAHAGTVMVLSTLSNTPVEEVVAAASSGSDTGAIWFQLYVYRDRGATAALVQRVRAAGCKALVLTVDAPLLGRRERDVRNRFALPAGLTVENLAAEGFGNVAHAAADSGLAAYFASLLDPSVTW